MGDREVESWLGTGESTDCTQCGHHLEHHHSVDDGSGICIMCADNGIFYHNFIARRQPSFIYSTRTS